MTSGLRFFRVVDFVDFRLDFLHLPAHVEVHQLRKHLLFLFDRHCANLLSGGGWSLFCCDVRLTLTICPDFFPSNRPSGHWGNPDRFDAVCVVIVRLFSQNGAIQA